MDYRTGVMGFAVYIQQEADLSVDIINCSVVQYGKVHGINLNDPFTLNKIANEKAE